MGFLFPLYLLGALAIGIPIVFHLRRRPPRDRVEFSSLMFLEEHQPVRRRRSRLENLILLALRCLALCLLAFLFGRPFWRDATALTNLGEGVLRVILVDRSASMQREEFWERAQDRVAQVLDESGPADQVSVMTFDADTEVLVHVSEWVQWPVSGRISAARQRIAGSSPGWGGTSLGAALIEAVALLEEEAGGNLQRRRAEIVVVSDWQSGASRDGLESFSWPETVRVRRIDVEPPRDARSNAAIHLLGRSRSETETGSEDRPVVKVRVTNGEQSSRERFRLAWDEAGTRADDGERPVVDVIVPPGGTRVVAAPPRQGDESCLRLTGDEVAFDNRIYVAPPVARPVRMLYLGASLDSQDTGEPLYYLSRALSETPSLAPEITARRIGELREEDLEKTDVIVVAGTPRDVETERIEQFLESGGTVWLPLTETMDAQRLPGLRGWGVELREREPEEYALWSGMDFQHPILRPFAPAGLRDFSKIHVWRYRELIVPESLPEDLEVLASYDTGGAALAAGSVGEGRLYVLSAGWLTRDSQLALSSKFVPLLYSMLRQAGFESDARRQFFVGDRLPDGNLAEEPGLVTWQREGDDEPTTLAVNLPVAESDLAPLEEALLVVPGLAVAREAAEGVGPAKSNAADLEERRERLRYAELEDQQRLWRWLLLGAAVVLLAESWWTSRNPRPAPAGSG